MTTPAQTTTPYVAALKRELTGEQWSALIDAAAGVQLTPERRDLVRGDHKIPALVTHTWAGGLRPDYQTVTHYGRALLAHLDEVWAALTESERAGLRGLVEPGWSAWETLETRKLVDKTDRCTFGCCEATPLGRAVLRRAEEHHDNHPL